MQFTRMKLGPTLKMCSYIAQLKLRARWRSVLFQEYLLTLHMQTWKLGHSLQDIDYKTRAFPMKTVDVLWRVLRI